jgi:hypothetical protein
MKVRLYRLAPMTILAGMRVRAAALLLGLVIAGMATRPAGASQEKAHPEEADRRPAPELASDLRWRNSLIIGGGGLAVFLYGQNKWWREGFTGNFRSADEGWFGNGTYAGGTDKLGHAWGTYLGTRAVARVLELAGNDPAGALRLATWSALGAYTAIEVLDGYSKQYRFSKEDAIANAAGAALAVLLEKNPALDRVLDFRLHYRRSPNAAFDPLSDYTGQTYLLVLKAGGMPRLSSHPVLRYVEFAAGYAARNFDEDPTLRETRSRNLYFGISLNLSALLDDTAFRDTPRSSWTRRLTSGALEVVQVPGTGVYAKHRF